MHSITATSMGVNSPQYQSTICKIYMPPCIQRQTTFAFKQFKSHDNGLNTNGE